MKRRFNGMGPFSRLYELRNATGLQKI